MGRTRADVSTDSAMRFSVLLFVLCIASFCQALYGPKSDVILLTKKNFDKEIMNSNHVWLVEFFAPWCGHCKQLAPAWEQAAKKLKGVVKIAAVDADAEREIGGRFGIKGFPTIKLFKSPVGESGKKGAKTPVDYNGGRTAKDIIAFATSSLPTKQISKLSSKSTLDKFLQSSELPKAILFTEKTNSPPVFTALSLEFHNRFSFGYAPKSAAEVVNEFGVDKFPVIVLVKEGQENIKFDGDLTPEKLNAFLKQHASAASSGSQEAEKEAEKEEEAPKAKKPQPTPEPEEPAAVYAATNDEVLKLHCSTRRNLCLIAFLDSLSDQHQHYQKVLLDVAEKNKQHLSVVWVDAPTQPDFFNHFQPSDLPSFRLWNSKRGAFTTVVAAVTADSLNKFVTEALAGRVRMGKISAPPAIVEGGVKFEPVEEIDLASLDEPAPKEEL